MERVKLLNISKNFGNKTLFHSINLSFCSKDIVGLSGVNGSGKTTFIRLLCGLVYPDSGQIFINGVESNKDREAWMQNIGVLLEGSRSLYWRISALQNVIYSLGLKKIFGKAALDLAEKNLKFFDLWDVRNNKVENFSFGMKQRLAIVCAISHNPSIVLLDEPTNGLDGSSLLLLKNYIVSLSHERKTFIIASHDTGFLNEIITKKLMINNCSINDI